jgi:outer membrane receptor protein involved in Fe transport
LFILVCLFFTARPLAASAVLQATQESFTIAGIVVDQNDAPVPNAEVTVANETSLSSKTDADGRFHFAAVPRRTITLVIKAQGFAPLERKLEATNEGTTKLRIVLSPAGVSAQVTITATRTETRIGETAASVVVLGPADLQTTAAITLDDALRQVPGFSLFRRSGSRTANPTAQGVSLRGLGASGASRALVLADGIPLNDPFGGWVYWDRIPRESVSQVEVLRGGASHLYGSTALGGVVSISTKRTDLNTLSLAASYGNEMTLNASVYLSGEKHSWAASLAAETFRTDGYVLVPQDQRGLVDTAAGSRDAVVNLKLERLFGENRRVFGTASFFGESRKNGTPLQTNRTHIRRFVLGGDWQTPAAGTIAVRSYGGTQVYDQNFSAINTSRNSESLTRVQRVPAQVFGASIQWSRAAGRHQTLVAGFEAQQVRGASDEIVFVNGRATSLVGAGGRELTLGGYLEDLVRVGSRLFLNAGGRFDRWRDYDALSASRPIAAANPTSLVRFPDRTESAFSPQLSAVYKINSRFSLLASGMRAFRAPTLNELYRSFRVGNVLTLANENLRAERLTGGDAGARVTALKEKLVGRGTAFWNEVTRPVANVTLQTTPALITRQRQNLGRTRSRGVEIETEARLNQFWNLTAGYLFADATVVRFPANTALDGLMIPQVARHQFTFQARYANPSIITVGVQGRASGAQFDDDQNVFRLGSYFTLDVFIARRVARGLEAFVAVENLFGQRYEIGKTPLVTLGPPTLIRGGFRFSRSLHR